MNKEEILAMEAGRDLDILVGKHVFGWTDEKTEQNTLFEMSANMWKPNDVYHCVPKYSTYLSVTWEVVEKMCFKKIECVFDLQLRYMGYWAIFNFEGKKIDSTQQKSAPEAICKAALLAVMDS